MKSIPIRPLPAAAMPRRPSGPTATPRWRLRWLFAAPHRLAFAAGALLLAASALWWVAVLAARVLDVPLPWVLAPALAHGLLMTFGHMPLFFAGFLYTAGPRWLGVAPVPARALLGPVLAMLAGWGLFLPAVHVPVQGLGPLLAAFGLAAVAGGWSALTWRFVRLLRASRVPDRVHATLIACACTFGALLLWTAAAAVLTGALQLLRPLLGLALWAYIGIVYVAVAHRMIPFFTAAAVPALDAWRPHALLVLFVAAMLGQALSAAVDAYLWPQPAWLHVLRAAWEGLAAAGLLALAVRWGLVQSLRMRLLAMLHLGYVWLGVAFALSALSQALLAAGRPPLGLAPLHAYTMGFLGSMLLAMATRVSCGHGGRTLTADQLAWGLFIVLQAAVWARLAAAWLDRPLALAGAALLWAAATVGWALRYGRWYGRPRFDGRPG